MSIRSGSSRQGVLAARAPGAAGRWLALGLLLAIGATLVVATHDALTAPHPGHNDFMSRWEGVRAFWYEGLNPYGEQASAQIQQRIYGRPAQPGEDPGYFAYPLYTVFLLWPLVHTSYAWAAAIWMVLLEACLIGAQLLLLDLFGWRPRRWLLAALLLWTLVQYFAARGLLLGQPGIVVYFLEVLALWGLARGRDRLAGGALAISTLKPQMGYLLVPFLLLWALRDRRWHFVAWFAGVFGALMLAAFVAEPGWLGDWIAQIRRYPSYTAIGSPVWVVMAHYLGLGTAGEWAVNLLLFGGLLGAWHAVLWQGRRERLDWTIMLTLTVTHLAAVRTATPHFVVFVIPLTFYLRKLSRRAQGGAWTGLALLALAALPWLHFLLTLDGDFEHPSMYLPLPFGGLALLWLTRRWWWDAPPVIERRTSGA